MKKLVLISIIAALSLPSFSQKSPVDDLFEKYYGREGFTSVYISSRMFSLLARIDTEDQEFQNLVSKIRGIRILAVDSATNVSGLTSSANCRKSLMPPAMRS